MPNPTLNIELTPRGQTPIAPQFPPLPQFMSHIPFGLDENGKHIKDIRGNVIKTVILSMLECVEKRVEYGSNIQKARDEALTQLISRLNACITNPLYHVTGDYLFKEGNLYSYEFNAFLHHICNEMADEPHYFFNIGLKIIPDSIGFLFNALSLNQMYTAMARIGSKFSSEQFEAMDVTENSIVIQRRTPATAEQLGDIGWLVHVTAGCHTLRAALSTFPRVHSKQTMAEIEERKCLLRGDDCCEWKFIWQTQKRSGWFNWLK